MLKSKDFDNNLLDWCTEPSTDSEHESEHDSVHD